jgi:hypothetical protein
MTDAEHHQQQLEEQEYSETVAHLKDEYGRETRVHIWSDEDTVFMNIGNWPLSFTVTFGKQQAEKVHELLTNALRRAE